MEIQNVRCFYWDMTIDGAAWRGFFYCGFLKARHEGRKKHAVFHGYRDFVRRYVSDQAATALNGSLIVLATKLWQRQPVVFESFQNKNDLLDKISASSALPYMLPFPYKMGKERFVDGGTLQERAWNLPTQRSSVVGLVPGWI